MKSQVYKDYRYNFIVNILDGGFFGAGIGFASFMTVLPLFVSTMTDSAILIGLIPAIHTVGWQLPQLFTSERVARLKRYKPMVIWMTIHERIPFFGLALVAWLLPGISVTTALVLTYFFLVWQGLGGGFTATAWQSMIGKIIPSERRGTFFGFQSSSANLLASGTAVAAGLLLERLETPLNYTVIFFLAGTAMTVSLVFLALTREAESPPEEVAVSQERLWKKTASILQRDSNLRWFLVVRILSQFSILAFAFYTVYAVRSLGMSEGTAGLMMGVFTVGQIIANPLMGWIGDRWSYAAVMKFGLLAASISALVAWFAPNFSWFFLAFVLAGLANVAIWTIGMAMTLQFGTTADRPIYIGMANTLIAPATVLAPILGGWLADNAGFQAAFLLSAIIGLVTTIIMHLTLRDPQPRSKQDTQAAINE
jgi:MFS family permease